jgi:hypothetical protein
MKESPLSISPGLNRFLFALVILCFPLSVLYDPAYAQSDSISDSLIQLLTPSEGTQIISKKPVIKCSIKVPFDPQKLLVLLDGTDISGILEITPEGFEYRPMGVLISGPHTLSITAYTAEGMELKKDFTFSTRHSKTFEEAYSNNEVTTLYEKKLGQSEKAITYPSWKEESNLASDSKLKEKGWEFSFNTNVRHFDQNLPVTPPLEKGLSLANYLFQGKYTANRFSFLSEIGDVQINETSNTVQGLARRGGNLVFQSQDLHLQLRSFVVKSEQVFGFNGGMGIEGTSDDHIMGVSGDLGLISDKLRFRTIYVKGGEEGDSLGISTMGGEKKGDVLGLLLTTDFFKQKLVTEAELDFSRFDADTSDEFPREDDKAYRLKIGGASGIYTYEGFYEYMGPEYEVIGNQGLQKNREGCTLKAGANHPIHVVNLSFAQYNDNVNKDDLFPRTYTYQGTADYIFKKFQSLPIGVSYQKTRLDSRWEPPETFPVKIDTDTVTGMINYIKPPWNLGFSTSYSVQNDLTDESNDTTNITLTLIPALTLDKPSLSVSPSYSFTRSISRLINVHTDTHTATLDLRGDLFDKKLSYGFGGTHSIFKTSDGSSNQDTLSTNFDVSYLLVKNFGGFLNPSVGIRGLYNRTNDRILNQSTNEFALFLVVQTLLSLSF